MCQSAAFKETVYKRILEDRALEDPLDTFLDTIEGDIIINDFALSYSARLSQNTVTSNV